MINEQDESYKLKVLNTNVISQSSISIFVLIPLRNKVKSKACNTKIRICFNSYNNKIKCLELTIEKTEKRIK